MFLAFRPSCSNVQLGNFQVPENCPLGCARPLQQAVQPHRACHRLPCHRDPLLARMRNGERLWIFHILIMSIDGKPKECCRNCKHNFQDRVLIVILSVIGSVSSGTLVSGLKWENWLDAEFISFLRFSWKLLSGMRRQVLLVWWTTLATWYSHR